MWRQRVVQKCTFHGKYTAVFLSIFEKSGDIKVSIATIVVT